MNPILLNPKIDSSASTTEQLAQMKSYLRQFKEQVELILMNIDSDNMSEKFQDEVYEGLSKKIMGNKSISEIAQTAGMLRMSVKDLEGSMSSLTITVNGIQSEVYDGQGNSRITQTANAIQSEITRATGAESSLSSRITQTENEISSEVSRAEGAESNLSSLISQTASAISLKVSKGEILDGLEQEMSSEISITSNYIRLTSGGSTKFEVNANGTVSITGEVYADEGTIGSFKFTERGGLLSAQSDLTLTGLIGCDVGFFRTITLGSKGDGSLENGNISGYSANFSLFNYKQVQWKKLSSVGSNEYVLTGGT